MTVFDGLKYYPKLLAMYGQIKAHGMATNAELGVSLRISERDAKFHTSVLTKLGLIDGNGIRSAPAETLAGLADGLLSLDCSNRVAVWGDARLAQYVPVVSQNVPTHLVKSEDVSMCSTGQLDAFAPETSPSGNYHLDVVSSTDNCINKTNTGITGKKRPRGRPPTDPASWDDDPDQPKILQVFEHWQKIMNYPKRRLDVKRRGKLKKLIASGYPIERMLQAIDNAKTDPFHKGGNDRGKRYHDIVTIFRDEPTTDEHADGRGPVTQKPSIHHPSQADMSITASKKVRRF